MANSSNFTVRLDPNIKAQSESIFSNLGINLTTAINVFLRKAIQTGGFPFDVRLEEPGKETLIAINEANALSEEIKNGKKVPFNTWEEAKAELMK